MNKLSLLKLSIDKEFIKQLFDHLRNYLICATLFAIGTLEYHQKPGEFLGINVGDYSGLPLILFAVVLFILNTYNGIRVSIVFLESLTLKLILIVLYLLITTRFMELAWKYSV
jgi:hypothetical protein